MVWGQGSTSFLCLWMSSYPCTTYWKDYSFPIVLASQLILQPVFVGCGLTDSSLDLFFTQTLFFSGFVEFHPLHMQTGH